MCGTLEPSMENAKSRWGVIFLPLPPLERCRRHSVFELFLRVCVRDHIINVIFVNTNRWREFHQSYKFGAVGNADELVRFWGQKVKRSGSQREMSADHSLTCIRNAWIYSEFNKTCQKFSLPDPPDAVDISRSRTQRPRSLTGNITQKCTFWRRHTDRQFAVEDHLVTYFTKLYASFRNDHLNIS